MRSGARLLVTVTLALLGCVLLAGTATLTSAITLAATTVLIMGGSGEPDPSLIPVYMTHVETYYLTPFGPCPSAGSCNYESLYTPEEFWPIPGWAGPRQSPSTNRRMTAQPTSSPH